MVILALDTTTAAGSVALAKDDHVLEVAPIDPLQPVATQLPGDLATVLDRHGIELPGIDVFAVATGPGSFTGLRIGIATMQGLALAQAKPLLGVSSFDALASLAQRNGVAAGASVAVWIDAWRGEIYASLYTRGTQVREPIVALPHTVLAELHVKDALFIGDGALKHRNVVPGPVVEPTPLIAGEVARIAHRRAAIGETPPPHAIRPLYVRRPDAELAREKSSG